PAGHPDLRRLPDLPRAGSALNLLDGVRVHPESRAPAADVATARRNRMRTLDADVPLVQVERLAALDARVPQALDAEDVEQPKAVVHVLEREVARLDAGTIEDHPPGVRARLFDLFEGERQAARSEAIRRDVQDVRRLL